MTDMGTFERGMSLGRKNKLCFGHVDFEMPVGHLNSPWAVDMKLELDMYI